MPEVSGNLITRVYSNFRGVDFSNTEVALYRSPDAINMWKDYKKMGTSIETRPDIVLFKELKNTVYGLFFYTINQVDHMIIHCGVSLYDYNMKTEELKMIKEKGMNVRKSQSFIYRNIFYIKDGLNYLQYDGETCKEVIGYIPVTTIGKAPSGGGTTNQDVNLLTGVRENSFCADGESTEYVLDANELDAGYQERVFINDVEKKEGFTVDKVSGKVNFTTAPEKPLTDGQDNVVIRFSKTIPGNRDKINKCTILEVFDNRVFFSGNQDYPNTVFHTMLDEPQYCSDLDYYNEGADISPVRDMVAGNNALWVIKEPSQANTAIFYHNPTIDSEAGKVYPSEHSSISTGCVGAAINFNDDIVFFSDRGMEGISGDITTQQVISHRSSLVDSKLLQEENYEDMILVKYEGYLLVIINNKIYLADSRAMFTNGNHNEYEWFYWEIDIKPTCAVVYNGELYLGSKQGIFKVGKASENNKEIIMTEDENEKYFIEGITKQETGTESYKTVTGKEITIKDGENSKGLEIKPKGSTNQSTRSGKNLFDLSKIRNAPSVFTVTETGVNLTNCWVTDVYTAEDILKTFKPNTKYTMKVKAKVVSRPSTIIAAEEDALFALYRPATNPLGYAFTRMLVMPDKKTINLNTEKEYISTFKTPADMTDVRFISYTFFGNNSGSTTGAGLGKIDVSEIMLAEGTYTAENFPNFELYGASPSPEFPSPIQNIEGDIEVKVTGKNLFKPDTVGLINIDGTINTQQPLGRVTDRIICKEGENFSLSWEVNNLQANIGVICFFDSTGNKLERIVETAKTQITAIAPGKTSYVMASIYDNTAMTNFQFEKGEPTDYEPYKEQIVYFPLSEGQKLMEGSYLADDGVHDDGGQYIFTGNENILLQLWDGAYRGAFAIADAKIYENSNNNGQLCNMFSYDVGSVLNLETEHKIGTFAQYRGTSSFYFIVEQTTLEELQAWLAEQYANGTPVIIEYKLAEPKVTPYTEAQQEAWNKIKALMTYKNVTNITSEAPVEVVYKKDLQYIFQNTGNINSRPIFKILKLDDEVIDIKINTVRLTYNFNGEEYVIIDCEEKEVKYEGLNRNRQINIGYEFPICDVGNNEISMYSSDCIVEAKRKDRWL